MEFLDHNSSQMDVAKDLLAWPSGEHWASMWFNSTCLFRIHECSRLQIQIQEGLCTDLGMNWPRPLEDESRD